MNHFIVYGFQHSYVYQNIMDQPRLCGYLISMVVALLGALILFKQDV